jgi:hypothetical protein
MTADTPHSKASAIICLLCFVDGLHFGLLNSVFAFALTPPVTSAVVIPGIFPQDPSFLHVGVISANPSLSS